MITIAVSEAFIQGAVSVERHDDALHPCRLPHHMRHLFPSPGDGFWRTSLATSGVRLRMETDAESITLTFSPLPSPNRKLMETHALDVVVENEIVQTVRCPEGATQATFDKIGKGLRTIEIWLPQSCPVGLKKIKARRASLVQPLPDRRPMWVTWGSSLTHCVRAHSPAMTWPAIVARRHGLNLVSLGFGGNCHLEPMVAHVIRDLPARYITMKLGINAVSHSLNNRTYPGLVAAAVAIIREKHPHTPLALISPMASPPRESTPTATGYTLQGMREDMSAVHRNFVAAGDMNLYYVDGLEFFGVKDIARFAAKDNVHPNAEGIVLQAERFSSMIIPLLLGRNDGVVRPSFAE